MLFLEVHHNLLLHNRLRLVSHIRTLFQVTLLRLPVRCAPRSWNSQQSVIVNVTRAERLKCCGGAISAACETRRHSGGSVIRRVIKTKRRSGTDEEISRSPPKSQSSPTLIFLPRAEGNAATAA